MEIYYHKSNFMKCHQCVRTVSKEDKFCKWSGIALRFHYGPLFIFLLDKLTIHILNSLCFI